MLDEGPHDRRRALGTQRQTAPAPVVELVHLLVDDLGVVADPAAEHLDVFEASGVIDQPVTRTVRPGRRSARRDLPPVRSGSRMSGCP